MKRTVFLLLLASMISGCVTMISKDVKKTFTYDYTVPNESSDTLWVRARDYFATIYGDSRSVMSVQDRKTDSLIGKGLVSWTLSASGTSVQCQAQYSIRFKSKQGKARMRIMLMNGAPALSDCVGWPRPTKKGYQQIKSHFLVIKKGLKGALNGSSSSFSDF